MSSEDFRSLGIFELQGKLEEAIVSENYSKAATLRDLIANRELDTRVAVEYANRQFYEAFQSGSLDEMKKIWSQGDHVQCIHPFQGCIATYDHVIESWKAVLPTVLKGSFCISLEDVRICASDEMAIVTCVECVTSGRDTGRILATNAYEFRQGEWKMILHHGSPDRQL